MRLDNWLLYPLISGFLYPYIVAEASGLGFMTGMGFTLAGASAIYNGYIFRNPGAIVVVYIGVLIGGEVTGLLLPAYQSTSSGDWISGVVLLVVAGYIWVWAQQLKRVDDEWEPGMFSKIRGWIDQLKGGH